LKQVLAITVIFLVGHTALSAPPAPSSADKVKPDRKDQFTLTITGDIDSDLAPVVGRLTTVFYQSYPKLVERFENPEKPASRNVQLVLERGLKVPAYCSGAKVTVSVEWLKEHPDDLGLLTHELTHVVQAYPSPEPGWLTEGLADYARHCYGPKEQPGWKLPQRFSDKESYKDGYGVTARFLVWLEARHPGVVGKLNRRMQERKYSDGDFQSFTGKSIDELWKECVRDLKKEP
jgi:hypothetical protein